MYRVLIPLALLPALLWATEVYKTVLPDGTVIYSDHPSEGAAPLSIKPIPASPPVTPVSPLPPQGPETAEAEPREPGYQGVTIIRPENDASIRDNAGNVTLEVSVKPGLLTAAGHRLRVELDGILLDGRFTGNTLSLSNVDRGSHSVMVVVVDKEDRVLVRSPAITFHLLRYSALQP